jgi:hypothetical protein
MTSDKTSNAKMQPGSWECEITELTAGMKGLVITGNPRRISSPYGNAIRFDGMNDGIFLQLNPLFGLSCFTIEALICPESDGPEEQRFLHIGEIDGDRLLIETRSTKDRKWFLDTFILSGRNKMALIDPKLVHPEGNWYHVALTVNENGQMMNYINGKLEITGNVDFKPIISGEMSIGARRNKVSWYKGAIYKIKICPEVLEPEDFMTFK